jgi:hypothetical protein
MQRRRNLSLAVFLIVICVALGAFVTMSVIMASGILPIPFGYLIGVGSAIGALIAVLAAFGSRWIRFGWCASLALIATLCLSPRFFLHFQRAGLEHALHYGAQWAESIERFHATRGQWPTRLQDATSAPSLELPSPYLKSCAGGVCDKVAGYFIVYIPSATKTPILHIARRDIVREWDWSRKQWRAAAARH